MSYSRRVTLSAVRQWTMSKSSVVAGAPCRRGFCHVPEESPHKTPEHVARNLVFRYDLSERFHQRQQTLFAEIE